jgi:hypothetical protein
VTLRILKSPTWAPLAIILSLVLNSMSLADSVKPLTYGPFFLNQLSSTVSPRGYDYVLSNIEYHFQIGWIEPIMENSKGLFRETYFEANSNITVSPFTSDLGTTFNLKPIRYFEVGLSYNRLLFHNSMVTYDRPAGGASLPPLEDARPLEVLSRYPKDPGGADIFTFQSNFTIDIGPTQLYLFGSRTLWDIDAKRKAFVYEYGTDILIRTRDRVNSLLAQFTYDLRSKSQFKAISFSGFNICNQYWYTTQTRLEKNLVSVGISGFRFGVNPKQQKRGLDLSLGYWTMHPQLPEADWSKSMVIIGDWKWNIQFFKI